LNPAPTVKLDREGRVVLANPAACEFFSVPDLMGRDWVSICPEAGELRLEELHTEPDSVRQEVGRHGKVMLLSYRNIPKTGTIHVYGFDITERKRSEEALRRSEARHVAVVDTAFDAIATMTPDGTIRTFNQGAERIFGYTAEEAIGQQLTLLMPERFQEPHTAGLRRYIETGEARVIGRRMVELMGRRKDGEEFPLELSITEVHQGKDSLFTGIIRDITERKRAEEALKQSERLYRAVIEQATENIFLVDAETRRIVDSNPAFRKTLGYTEKELKSMTLYDIADADCKSIDANVRRILEKDTFVGERKYRRKNGSLADVEVSVSTILRNGRETLCIVAHDVTERKKNEEAQRFLAEIGASLSSSLDYRTTLARVARLAVPYLADWCVVDVLEEDGSLDRLALTHQDPEKVTLAQQLEERYPPDPEAQHGAAQVLRTGRRLSPRSPNLL
jgi:PAS domain S-box-containing protein